MLPVRSCFPRGPSHNERRVQDILANTLQRARQTSGPIAASKSKPYRIQQIDAHFARSLGVSEL
jgi:hypothetical protein